jgi:hypothetical protein
LVIKTLDLDRIRIETNADPQSGGKFAILDTGGGQFAAGVVDTGGFTLNCEYLRE